MKRLLLTLGLFLALSAPAFAQLGGGGGSCNSTGSGAIASGTISLNGATSGVVTVQPQAAAGTYNFNLPTTAGTAGQVLTSQGGSSTAMTWTAPPVVISWTD